MRAWAVIVVLACSAASAARQDDATLRRLIVGTWSMIPPVTYRSDGTFTDGRRIGTWRIEHGLLLRNWRYRDSVTDTQSTDEIIDISRKRLTFRTFLHRYPSQPDRTPFPIDTLDRITPRNASSQQV